jgi:hypothetical protein
MRSMIPAVLTVSLRAVQTVVSKVGFLEASRKSKSILEN